MPSISGEFSEAELFDLWLCDLLAANGQAVEVRTSADFGDLRVGTWQVAERKSIEHKVATMALVTFKDGSVARVVVDKLGMRAGR